MAKGFASDINGDDTVMDSPEATISIDISQLPARQALAIAREAGLDQLNSYNIGELVKGEVPPDLNNAEFDIPIEAALTALEELGITDSNQPTEVESEDSSTPEP